MRKIISLLLVFAALFTFAACENTPQISSAGESSTEENSLSAKEVLGSITDEDLTDAFLHPQTFTEEETEKYTAMLKLYDEAIGLSVSPGLNWSSPEELSPTSMMMAAMAIARDDSETSGKMDIWKMDADCTEKCLFSRFGTFDVSFLHKKGACGYNQEKGIYEFFCLGNKYTEECSTGIALKKAESRDGFLVLYASGTSEEQTGTCAVLIREDGENIRYCGARSNVKSSEKKRVEDYTKKIYEDFSAAVLLGDDKTTLIDNDHPMTADMVETFAFLLRTDYWRQPYTNLPNVIIIEGEFCGVCEKQTVAYPAEIMEAFAKKWGDVPAEEMRMLVNYDAKTNSYCLRDCNSGGVLKKKISNVQAVQKEDYWIVTYDMKVLYVDGISQCTLTLKPNGDDFDFVSLKIQYEK